ncbi:MAG: Uma2 family endonuclease [Actinomycetota bacterium]|nr:Uma2 family endonuclease [Actinomycetota bacterium]
MRAVLVNVSEALVAERHRLGIDKQDERWEGEWHFVNPPKLWHPRLNADLFLVLAPLARLAGIEPYGDSAGVFADIERDWRVPDQVYVRPDQEMEEGVTGAELVVELRSPGDESYAKLPFYAARGITEALVVHRDRRFELFRLGSDGSYAPVADGRSVVLGVTFATVDGPKLQVAWEDGSAEV